MLKNHPLTLEKSLLIFLFVLTPIFSQDAYGCQFNLDCGIGSKCVKPLGSLNGVCMGGLFPGNRYDDKPVYDPLDLNRPRTFANTCSFNTDCGIGMQCAKSPGAIQGTCVKRSFGGFTCNSNFQCGIGGKCVGGRCY